MVGVDRGDVFDVDLPEIGVRPGAVVTRQEALPVLSRVTVVVATSTVRGHPAEVPLGAEHGLDRDCVANCDDIVTVNQSRLLRVEVASSRKTPRCSTVLSAWRWA